MSPDDRVSTGVDRSRWWLSWLVIRIVVRSDFKVPQGTQNPETLKLDPCFVVSERGGQTLIVRFWHESTARAMYT